jgi:hypothetical protein
MARRKKLKGGWGLEVNERVHLKTLDHTIIIYECFDGEKEDLATTITRRMAMFKNGEAPDASANLAEWATANASDRDKRDWEYYGFDGLPKTLYDQELETLKECDHEAEDFRNAMEQATQEVTSDYDYDTGTYRRKGASPYEKFLSAIDVIAEDYENAEAWKTINEYRADQLARTERYAKNL